MKNTRGCRGSSGSCSVASVPMTAAAMITSVRPWGEGEAFPRSFIWFLFFLVCRLACYSLFLFFSVPACQGNVLCFHSLKLLPTDRASSLIGDAALKFRSSEAERSDIVQKEVSQFLHLSHRKKKHHYLPLGANEINSNCLTNFLTYSLACSRVRSVYAVAAVSLLGC